MKKQNSKQNVMVEKMVVFVKTFDHYHGKFNLVTFSAVQWNCKIIWNWSLDRNLIMVLLIMVIYSGLFGKLYTILRWKEPILFKVKFDTKTNSNTQNVHLICFRLEMATLFGQICPKNQNI